MAKSLPTEGDSKLSKKSSNKFSKEVAIVSEDVEAKYNATPAAIRETPRKSSGPDGIDTETMFENKKARKRAIRAARRSKPTDDDVSSTAEGLSSKKRKISADDGNGDDTNPTNPEASAEEPPRKKHKNRTEFVDPRYDKSLNPQSRKALEYAFTQMNKPSKWKFHKAKQNWLIRNIWSPELVPETYIPLIWKYLANIQGGSRQKLIETCQSYRKVEEKKGSETGNTAETRIETTNSISNLTTASPSTTPPPPLKSILKPAPGPLIPGPLIDIPSTSTPKSEDVVMKGATMSTESVLAPAALADIRYTRARGLLEILGAN